MPRYVILQHDDSRGVHWDFMLESGSVLLTWALRLPPAMDHAVPASSLADHRPKYLDYEGPISDGRGTVLRWDEGVYELVERTDGHLVAELSGDKLTGRVELERLGDEADEWVLRVR